MTALWKSALLLRLRRDEVDISWRRTANALSVTAMSAPTRRSSGDVKLKARCPKLMDGVSWFAATQSRIIAA